MQTPPSSRLQTAPGGAGLMDGVNELGPPGVSVPFSVGDSVGAELDAGVVVGVVVGDSFVLLPQPAVNAPIATIAVPPSTNETLRTT